MNTQKSFLGLLATVAVATLTMTSCAATNAGDNSTAEADADSAMSSVPVGDEISTTEDESIAKLVPKDIREAEVLNVAVDIPYPPMAMYDDNNRAIGFDPELARLLGQKMGIEVSINKQAFDAVIPSLQANKNDIIMSGVNDTKEREETLSFVSYTHGGFAILVPAGNPKNIQTMTDLCGMTVSVQKATVQGELLRAADCPGNTEITVMELPLDTDAQTALRAGKSDAYSADGVVAEYVAQTTNDGETFDVVRDKENPAGFNPVYSGIGILKEETELVDAIQAGMQALIDEGTYQEVLKRNNIDAYAIDKAEVNIGGRE